MMMMMTKIIDENNSYDNNAKRILSDKQVLTHILKECVSEYKDLSNKEIYDLIDDNDGRYITGINVEDNKLDGFGIRYDILFTTKLPNSDEKIGLYINIEAQNALLSDQEFFSRALYYASRLISRQKNESFIHDEYEKIKKVYSIWICTTPSKEKQNVFNIYTFNETSLANIYNIKTDIKMINIIFLGLGDNYDYNDSKGLLQLLSLLFRKTIFDPKHISNLLDTKYNIIYSESEVEAMPNLAIGYYNQGYDKGLIEGKILSLVSSINNLIDSGIPKDKAIALLKIDDDIKQEVLNKLS